MILLLVLCSVLVNVEAIAAPNPDGEQSGDIQVSQNTEASASQTGQQPNPGSAASAEPQGGGSKPKKKKESSKESPELEQTKRMFGVVPNFAAVSAGVKFSPLTPKEKFKLATEDSFDYSAFVWTGILAAQTMGLGSDPEFGDGMAAYGNYYWHGFVDGVSGTFFTEAIMPVLTHEDPRYFTLGHGGFFRRLGFALSRTVITPTDSGGRSFNVSEIGGNAAEAALAQLYYPSEERGWSKWAENWGAQIESAALNNIAKEFWPDIRRYVFRRK